VWGRKRKGGEGWAEQRRKEGIEMHGTPAVFAHSVLRPVLPVSPAVLDSAALPRSVAVKSQVQRRGTGCSDFAEGERAHCGLRERPGVGSQESQWGRARDK